MPKQTARFALRSATATDHERVDHIFGGLDLSERDRYRSFLLAQAEAHFAIEAGIDNSAIASRLSDWPTRRRSGLLKADLVDLGAVPPDVDHLPTYKSVEAALGAAYVLEGSRLGGTMLVRAVPVDFPRRFLGAGNSALWQRFIETIDEALISQDQLDAAIDAARAAFSRFEISARSHQGML